MQFVSKLKRVETLWFLLSLCLFSIWLVGFYPANMGFDSLLAWQQSESFSFDYMQTFTYPIVISLVRRIWNSPASISFFQIIVSSVLVTYGLSVFKRQGVSMLSLWSAFVLFVFLLPIGFYNVSVFKDVLFTQAILFFAIRWIVDGYEQTKTLSWVKLIAYMLLLAFIDLMRHNGIIYVGLIPLLYFVFKRAKARQCLVMFCGSLAVVYVVTQSVTALWSVDYSRIPLFKVLPRLQSVAAAVAGLGNNAGVVEAADRETIGKLVPVSDLAQRYHCTSFDYLYINNQNFHESVVYDPTTYRELIKSLNHVIIKNIPSALGDRVCLFSHLLGLGELRWAYNAPTGIFKNSVGLSVQAPSLINAKFLSLIEWSQRFPQRILFWCHAFYLLFFFVAFCVGCVAKDTKLLGFVIIICGGVPFLLVAGPARDYRYLLILPYALPFVLLAATSTWKAFLRKLSANR